MSATMTREDAQSLILRLLMQRGKLDQEHLTAIREAQMKEKGSLEEILIHKGLTPERDIAAIAHAIHAHSFSAQLAPETLEAQVVEDADTLRGNAGKKAREIAAATGQTEGACKRIHHSGVPPQKHGLLDASIRHFHQS